METAKPVKTTRLSRNTMAVMGLVGCVFIILGTSGATLAAGSMSVVPMAERFGVEVSQTQLYYTFWCLGVVISALFASKLLVKFNVNGCALIGGILGLISIAMMAFSGNIWIYWLGAFISGFPTCISGAALVQTFVSKWYYKGRATILAVVCVSELFGSAFVSFTTAHFVSNRENGIATSMMAAAILVFLCNVIPALFLLKGCPEDYGWVPIGQEKASFASENDAVDLPGISREVMFKKPYFWCFLMAQFAVNLGYGLIQPQVATYTQFCGYTATQAAVCVTIFSAGKCASKFLYGYLGDRYGLRVGLCLTMAFSVVTGILYIFTTNLYVIYLCAVGMGFCGGLAGAGTMGLSRMMGQKDFSKVAILPHFFNGVGNMLGPIGFRMMYTGTFAGWRTIATVSVIVLSSYLLLDGYALKKEHMFENERAI